MLWFSVKHLCFECATNLLCVHGNSTIAGWGFSLGTSVSHNVWVKIIKSLTFTVGGAPILAWEQTAQTHLNLPLCHFKQFSLLNHSAWNIQFSKWPLNPNLLPYLDQLIVVDRTQSRARILQIKEEICCSVDVSIFIRPFSSFKIGRTLSVKRKLLRYWITPQ